MGLRDYQILAENQIKENFSKGIKKVLLFLATGAGKTVIFCDMSKKSIDNGKRVVILTRGRKLIKQASERLFREHVPHGVFMANHWNFRPHLSCQVASIDTLLARDIFPPADLLIVDEADLFTENSKAGKAIKERYPDAFIVSCTATPYSSGSLRHLANTVVHPITTHELIQQGFLCGGRYFAPSAPDLRGVRIDSKTKDYVTDQLEERMVTGKITGDVVLHWKNLAENRRTILFAVNVHHSRLMAETLSGAGIPSEHCDADTPDNEREKIIRRLEDGKTRIVCNVGIFGRGVDVPSLGCGIMARPTKSRNLFIQQAGRLTRLFPGKEDFILLDHAGNLFKHGFPTFEPDVDLDGRAVSERDVAPKICKVCFAVYEGEACPGCGTVPHVDRGAATDVTVNDGELKEIVATDVDPIKNLISLIESQRGSRKPGWVWYKLIEKVGEEKAKPYLPDWFKRYTKQSDDIFGSSPFKPRSTA